MPLAISHWRAKNANANAKPDAKKIQIKKRKKGESPNLVLPFSECATYHFLMRR